MWSLCCLFYGDNPPSEDTKRETHPTCDAFTPSPMARRRNSLSKTEGWGLGAWTKPPPSPPSPTHTRMRRGMAPTTAGTTGTTATS